MFQFSYKLKIAERGEGRSANDIPATTPSVTDAEASRVDARHASPFTTSTRRALHSTLRTATS